MPKILVIKEQALVAYTNSRKGEVRMLEIEVPVDLFPEKVGYGGRINEIIYAGDLVKIDEATPRPDYGELEKYFSPLTVLVNTPPYIGTDGVLAFTEIGDSIYISAIAIPVRNFGSGIAARMLSVLEAIADERRIFCLALNTRVRMRSYYFFQKHGFCVVRQIPDSGGGLVRMEKHL